MPGAEKLAVVSTAAGFPKVTMPGPETFDQLVVRAPGGLGRPSSATVPSRLAEAGEVMVWSAPADTDGAALAPEAPLLVAALPESRIIPLRPAQSTFDDPFQQRPEAMNCHW